MAVSDMTSSNDSHALILTPLGRDAQLAQRLLSEVGIAAAICESLEDVCKQLNDRVSFLVITEDAVRTGDLKPLSNWLAEQATWSDLPIVLIVAHGSGPERNPAAARYTDVLGNVSFIERPFHPTTFVSMARSALRSRRRQYDARSRLAEVYESGERLKTALKAGRLGSWELNIGDLALTVSDDCKANFGRQPDDEFTFQDLHASIHPEDRQRVVEAINESVANSGLYAVEYRVIYPDGSTHWVEVRARVLKNSDGAVRMAGVSADITARKSAEENLRKLNETLEERVVERTHELEKAHAEAMEQAAERERAETLLRQSQKMEAVGQLTGGVAHDFNNLLMAVLGNLDLLRKHSATDQKSQRLIDGAMQGARRGASLTQRLLAFSRQQDLEVRPVDLRALVIGMNDLFQRSIGPVTDFRIDAMEGLPPASVDANQIELALLNLVVNARDAMPKGGTLTVALHGRRSTDASLPAGDYLVLSVSDTGIGMDEETLKRAIEPFYSTKERGKGTGLGLSMIHGLAVQLKGKLTLISKVGEGTRAELWLPASSEPIATDVSIAPPQEKTGEIKSSTILVVDDDVLIAMSTVDMLEDLGHSVIEANSGAQALDILKTGRVVDLLITDHSMPKMTGSQLVEAARRLRPELPVLLATGYAELPYGETLDVPRLSKPYSQDQLATEIAKIIA